MILDGKSSSIILKDNLLSLTVAGVFEKENKTFFRAPLISSEQLDGRFQTYVQYDEFHTDWSEIIERENHTATVDQLILYHHNKEFRRERFSEAIMIKHGFILITEKTLEDLSLSQKAKQFSKDFPHLKIYSQLNFKKNVIQCNQT